LPHGGNPVELSQERLGNGSPERMASTWPLICFCSALDMGSKYRKGPEEGLLGKVERKIL
jgi:hypothetical protein